MTHATIHPKKTRRANNVEDADGKVVVTVSPLWPQPAPTGVHRGPVSRRPENFGNLILAAEWVVRSYMPISWVIIDHAAQTF